MTTLFVVPELWESERLELGGDDFHHLFRVSRLAVGDSLRVADGDGRARGGEIASVHRDRAELRLGDRIAANEPEADVELLVAAPRKPRAEWLVEKTTELGVSAVRFLQSERGPRSYGAGAFRRFRRVARSAAAQCERSRIPEITGMHPGAEVPDLVVGSSRCVVLDRSGPPFSSLALGQSVSVLVGPEGGWTSAELAAFGGRGFLIAGLGSRTLRVETAGVLAVASCVLPH